MSTSLDDTFQVGICGDHMPPLLVGGISVASFVCDLPHGHEGRHGCAQGASWGRAEPLTAADIEAVASNLAATSSKLGDQPTSSWPPAAPRVWNAGDPEPQGVNRVWDCDGELWSRAGWECETGVYTDDWDEVLDWAPLTEAPPKPEASDAQSDELPVGEDAAPGRDRSEAGPGDGVKAQEQREGGAPGVLVQDVPGVAPDVAAPAWLDAAIEAGAQAGRAAVVKSPISSWQEVGADAREWYRALARAAAPHIRRAVLLDAAQAWDAYDVRGEDFHVTDWLRERAVGGNG